MSTLVSAARRSVWSAGLLWWGGLLLGCVLHAQGTRTDYERATTLPQRTENKVFRQRVTPHWLPGDTRFWYEVQTGPEQHAFILVDAVAGTRQAAFDHARLAAVLTQAGGSKVEAHRLPLERLKFLSEPQAVLFDAGGKRWRCDLTSYRLEAADAAGTDEGSLRAGERPHRSRRTGAETSITFLNRTDREIDIYWLDTDGGEKRYHTLKPGEQKRQHTFAGHVWKATTKDGGLLAVFEATDDAGTAAITRTEPIAQSTEEPKPAPADTGAESPDRKWSVFLREANVVLRDKGTGSDRILTTDGKPGDAYEGAVFWAPDSSRFVVMRTLDGDHRQVHFVESSPKDQLQPKLHTLDYAKPGDRMPVSKPHLFEAATGRHLEIADTLFPNPWSNEELRWAPDSSRFTFVYNQRGHQVLRVISVEAATGQARAVVDEQSKTFIDYAGKQYLHHLDKTGEVLWMSERDGWNHLYLYDVQTGQVKHQLTRGEWVVREVQRVDEDKRQLWFFASGIRPGQDPYYRHLARVNFDGSGLVVLTEGDGTHDISFSPDQRFILDTWSRVDQPPTTELRRSEDGRLVAVLEKADWTALLKTGWRPPERFVAKARDNRTDIYGIIYRPSNFKKGRKYPVIEEIYAGPQGAFVPKGFGLHHRQQGIAELGFIVVQIDGMGTSERSKAFHDLCWQNLGDAGFPDRILWMQAAAAKYPQMDLTRVGIYGGSAGGQNALRAVLAYPSFYKAAVADCGCHDNRMDKIWWNELWMGWPIGPHYAEQSNVTQAHRLQGKLLLVVGEMDNNVDPASTMQVANALIKADKDFDLLVVPGAGHGIAESPYGSRRRMDFFVRHLLGVEPRH
jgi:dipeptidyl aminopeptidase/acylaminoacyl peptidase